MPDDDLAETQLASDALSSAPARANGPAARFVEASELGRGGMGRVFEAHDSALDRTVAIKQSLANDPAILARFEREVRITAKLQHPGIVPILDAGRDAEGRPYYVMDGRPLAELIAEAKTVEARLALVPNVLAAVDACAYANARRVIHRDIKPWNAVIDPDNGQLIFRDQSCARTQRSSRATASAIGSSRNSAGSTSQV